MQQVGPHLTNATRDVVAGIMHNDRAALALRGGARGARAPDIDSMQSLRDKATLAGRIADALGGRELEQLLTSPPDELDGARACTRCVTCGTTSSRKCSST